MKLEFEIDTWINTELKDGVLEISTHDMNGNEIVIKTKNKIHINNFIEEVCLLELEGGEDD
jgi:hypothetical protein